MDDKQQETKAADNTTIEKTTGNIPSTSATCPESDEQLLKKKLEELRKRDPFIYR
jgi:hypothetical protein